MKVKFTIEKDQETEKTGAFSKRQVEMYNLNASFSPSELEKKIFNDHPLFKEMVFMEYSEVDKFTTGIVFKDTHSSDNLKRISVGAIYSSPTFQFKAYSIHRIVELRSLILVAGEEFANNVKVLEGLVGSEEVEFKAKA